MTRLFHTLALVLLATTTAVPAAAQFGGLKKKVKAAAQPTAATPAAETGGGTLVLDDEVIERLIKGLRAGKAYRETAAKADTPYGRYHRAQAAYADAKVKCQAGQQTFYQRMMADPKVGEKNSLYLERMTAAMEKSDTAAQRAWGDSMAALQDPACAAKEPRQPSDWYDHQREVESGAEGAERQTSGFEGRELGTIKDRVIPIIQDAPPPDMSPSEQAAVDKREKDLKDLMNLNPPPQEPAPTPAPAPAAVPSQPTPTVSPGQQAAAQCMGENTKKHEKEIERLGAKINAAAQAGDTPTMMALADTLQRLQMAGCQ